MRWLKNNTLRFVAIILSAFISAKGQAETVADLLPTFVPLLPFTINDSPVGLSFFPTAPAARNSLSRTARLSMDAHTTLTPGGLPKGIIFYVTNLQVTNPNPNFSQHIVNLNPQLPNMPDMFCQHSFGGGNCPVASFVLDRLPNDGKFSLPGNARRQIQVKVNLQLGASTNSGQVCAIAHFVVFKDGNRKNLSPSNRIMKQIGVYCSTRPGQGNRSSIHASFDLNTYELGLLPDPADRNLKGPISAAIEVTCTYGHILPSGVVTCEAVQPRVDMTYFENLTPAYSPPNPVIPYLPGEPGEFIFY